MSLADYVQKERQKEVSHDEVRAYYDAHNSSEKKYWIPEKRIGSSSLITPKEYSVKITDSAINSYYEDNKTTLFADKPAQLEVRYILIDKDFVSEDGLFAYDFLIQKRAELVQNPSDFARVAEQFSVDPSAKNGGKLKPFERGEQEHALERAAFVLQQDNAISDVIEMQQGYALVQRIRKIARTFKPLDAVRTEIKKRLIEREFKELFTAELKELLDVTPIEQKSELVRQFITKRGS